MTDGPHTRRRLLRAVGAGLVTGLAGCAALSRDNQSTSPPTDSHRSPTATNEPTATVTATPETVYDWHYDTLGDVVGVADGLVFAREVGSNYEGATDADGSIIGLEVETGERQWSYGSVGRWDRYGFPVVDDALYFSHNDDVRDDPPGDVHCVEFDGTERWVREGQSSVAEIQTTSDTVYAMRYTDDVTAYDKTGGETRWRFEPSSVTGWTGDNYGSPTLALDEEMVYISHDIVVAFRPSTQQVAWTYGDRAEYAWVRAAAAGTAFVETPRGIGAVTDGAEQWFHETSEVSIVGTVADQLLVFDAASGLLRALDPATGETDWETSLAGDQNLEIVDSTATTAFLRARGGRTFAVVDLDSGTVRWTPEFEWIEVVVRTATETESPQPQVYFRSIDGRLRRCTADGEVVWTKAVEDIQSNSLAADDGYVFLGGDTGMYGIPTN